MLFHSLSCFIDTRLVDLAETDRKVSIKSAGIYTRQYWRKISHLASFISDLQKTLVEKENALVELESKCKSIHNQQISQKPSLTEPSKKISLEQSKNIANETTARSSQTVETAFKPCECCGIVQDCFRLLLDRISQVTVAQNMPSAVVKILKCYSGVEWFSSNDLQRIVPDLVSDLDKIQRQWTWLQSQIDPLNRDVEMKAKEVSKLKADLIQTKSDLKVNFEIGIFFLLLYSLWLLFLDAWLYAR